MPPVPGPMVPAPISPFTPFIRHLGPTVALQETIYGLVMVLASASAFSLAFGLTDETRWTVVFASLAVSLAWGFVDMVMWVITRNFDRMRRFYLLERIKKHHGEEWTAEAVEEEVEDTIVGTLDPRDKERICQAILESTRRAPLPDRNIEREAVWGGISAFIITTMTAVPVLAAVALAEPPTVGLRAASLLNVVLLFLVGFSWAPYAGLNKWKTGLILMLVGWAITLTTIALGG